MQLIPLQLNFWKIVLINLNKYSKKITQVRKKWLEKKILLKTLRPSLNTIYLIVAILKVSMNLLT